MSAPLASLTTAPQVHPTGAPRPAGSGWLLSPGLDLVFLANIAWPLVLLAPLSESYGGHSGLQFWQLYYITTPHRWITLVLVFLDRERFAQRKGLFLGLAAAAIVLCLGVRLTTGALTCLLTIDYVWNAWHFASQHHGIYRIYGRLGNVAPPARFDVEKWSLRGFLLYVILRVASATWSDDSWGRSLRVVDWLAVIVPVALLVTEIVRPKAKPAGRLAYLFSVSSLYLSLLWAVHTQRPDLVLLLATASALFHAIEYLTLVTWSVRQRHAAQGDALGVLGQLASRWALALGIFVLVLGAGGWFLDTRYLETWLFINVIVAFLHYAYDGLLWRRRPASSQH